MSTKTASSWPHRLHASGCRLSLVQSIFSLVAAGLLASLFPHSLSAAPIGSGGNGMEGDDEAGAGAFALSTAWNSPVQSVEESTAESDSDGSPPMMYDLSYEASSTGPTGTGLSDSSDAETSVLSFGQNVLRPTWSQLVQGEAENFPDPDPEGSGPITFELLYEGSSPGFIGTDFNDFLDVEISGLSLGQSVLLERFLVDNDQGVINGNAVLMDSRVITDGELRRVGGEVNFDEVMDYYEIDQEAVTDRDGVIYAYFPLREGFDLLPGEYVYRVSSPQDSFTAQTEQLTIVDTPEPQYYTGRVETPAGDPVPGALVGLLQPVGGYSHLRRVTVADANGDYTLYAPFSDEFDLVAVAPGFVGPFAVGTEQFIAEDGVVARDLTLTAGTRTMSGTVVDETTGEPIAGLPVTFMTTDASGIPDDRRFTQTWTDAQGQFSVAVTDETWGITFKPRDVSSRGYLTNAAELLQTVDLSSGDASNVQVPLTRGTSLITGTLASEEFTDGAGDPLPIEGVEVFAINLKANRAVTGVTYEDGWFNLPVTPGHWVVFPFSYDLEVALHPGSMSYQAYIAGPNQSLNLDIPVPAIGGVLDGFVTDELDDPVGRLRFVAFNSSRNNQENVVQASFASDGYYNFYLAPGSWSVFPDAESAAERQLLFADLPAVLIPETGDPFTDNTTTLPINVVAPTGTIEITLVDGAGNPVSDIKMHGIMEGSDGVFYDNFGRTDASGVAVLPARDGDWDIHLSAADLRGTGRQAPPALNVTLAGASATLQQTLEPFDTSGSDLSLTAQGMSEDESEFYLTGRGEPGQRYIVEGSNDLESWSVLGRITAIGGAFSISDKAGPALEGSDASSPSVFYRVKTDD